MLKTSYRKLGYGKDREGLMTRYINESANWDSHIRQCKNFVVRAIQKRVNSTAVIMGSGWWLDIPVEQLAEYFDELYMIDISHPRQIENKAKRYTNIHLVSGDVTGVMDSVYHLVKKNKDNTEANDILELINTANPLNTLNIPDADFCLSINLLSQIGVFLEEFLRKKTKISESDIIQITEALQSAHINLLPKNKSCLITDYTENLFYSNSEKNSIQKLIYAKLPKSREKNVWKWYFDLSGNYKKSKEAVFNVLALNF